MALILTLERLYSTSLTGPSQLSLGTATDGSLSSGGWAAFPAGNRGLNVKKQWPFSFAAGS